MSRHGPSSTDGFQVSYAGFFVTIMTIFLYFSKLTMYFILDLDLKIKFVKKWNISCVLLQATAIIGV